MKPFRAVFAVVVVAIFGMALSASSAWATSPPNDNFADATQLTGKFQLAEGNTISSTVEAGEPVHNNSDGTRSVWFKWTAPANGSVTLGACGSDPEAYVQVYTGNAVNSLTSLGGGSCRTWFDAAAGTEYRITVYAPAASETGFFRLSLTEPGLPANDNFADAETLTGNSVALTGNNAGATRETGEPLHNGSNDVHTVWYKWTAPGNGFVSYNACRTDFDTATAVYTGNAVGALTPVSASYCGKQFPVVSGTTYYLAVSSVPGYGVGRFYMTLNFFNGAPANDNLANSQVIPAGGGEIAGTTGGATSEAGELSTGDAGATVWYSWTPATGGTALFQNCRVDDIGFHINLWLGDTIGGLSYVTSGGCQLHVPVLASTTYRVQVTADDESDPGDFTLKVSRPAAPANDDFASAIPVTSQSFNGGGTFTGASRQPGENDPGGNGTGTVWYSWTAPSSTQVTIDTCGSNFDTYLAVFAGNTFPLALLGNNDDSGSDECGLRSTYTFTPTMGQVYRIAVSAYSTNGIGDYKLRIYPGVMQPLKYTITAAKTGTGSGTVYRQEYDRINCGPKCSEQVNDGTFIRMFAVADEGSVFMGWQNRPSCPGTVDCRISTTGNETVTALFTDVTPKSLTVTKAGTGTGTVSSDPAGIDCGATCSHTYDYNTQVTLTATPASGSTFSGWSGACAGTGPCQVTLDVAKAVTATFARTPVALTLKTGKAKLNKKKGTATIPVTVNAAATITLTGKNVKKKTAKVKAAKTVRLAVIAKGKLKKTLKRKRKAVAKLKITAKPASGGKTLVKKIKVTLKLKKKKRR